MSMKVKLECGGEVAIYPGKGKDDPPVLTVIDDEDKSAVVTSSTAAQPCKPGCIHQEPHAVEECLTHAEFMALGVDTDE